MGMPAKGTQAYDDLAVETGGGSTLPGFDDDAHIEATRGSSVGSLEDYIDPFEMVIQRLYTAAFRRAPDKDGLSFWTEVANDPLTNFKEISSNFINSDELSVIAPSRLN